MLFVVIFLIIAGIMIVQFWWLFLIIGALVAGIILLCVAVTKTTCPLCKPLLEKTGIVFETKSPTAKTGDFTN